MQNPDATSYFAGAHSRMPHGTMNPTMPHGTMNPTMPHGTMNPTMQWTVPLQTNLAASLS